MAFTQTVNRITGRLQ